ncbi:TPA: hypothetical protein ACH3X2_005734 [Trebouxia sp. C0005]
MCDLAEDAASKMRSADIDSLRGRLTSATCNFSQHLATQRGACLAQIWVPDSQANGPVTLHTQGVPFSVAGCADLLALFRCVSCRYKFGTDISKPVLMGAVGRVFSTGQPEMSHNVQQYDKRHFLRVEEAHRCRVHSALFMPLFTSANRHQPFAVFEVVQADTDVVFPVLVHWLVCCLQDVQLFTADADQQALTMGLRTHPIGPIKQDPIPQDGCTTSNVAFQEEPDSQENNTQQDLAPQAHCSANSLHAQGHLQGVTAQSDAVNKPACNLREVTADSEEVKCSTSRESNGGSPQSSNPASLGQQRMSSTQRQQSEDLQTGSGGSCAMPVGNGVASCPPATLVAVGKTLQMQVSSPLADLQTPLFAASQSVPITSAAVKVATAVTSPFTQQQAQHQMQQQQQLHQQHQHQLQFLANALQLQSQLNAQTQMRSATPATGGSAFAGYQPFSPSMGEPLPCGSHPQPKGDEEEGSPVGDEDMQVNNRVAGGAGKRLSVEDLQSQFGVGLREAAHNLRICPTTLKRACRRHGIYRWPRRQSWGGGPGDAGRTESMNLDGDSVSSAGEAGRLTSSSSGPLPGSLPGGLPGQSLEAFRGMDSSAQLAFLQHLAAVKRGTADSKWLQGTNLNATLKLPALPRATVTAVGPPSAVPPHSTQGRQLGSGLVVSMLAKGADQVLQEPGKMLQPGLPQQRLVGPTAVMQQPGMARQHSMPVMPCQQAQLTQLGLQKGLVQPYFGRQNSAGVVPGLGRQGSAGLAQGIIPLSKSLPQGITQQPNLSAVLAQGIAQQPHMASHFSSGLLHQTGVEPAHNSTSSSSCFTSVFSSQLPSVPPAWQQQQQQHQHQQQILTASHLTSMMTQQPQQSMMADALQPKHCGSSDQASLLDSMDCMQSPGNVGLESTSGQGNAAMQFDSSDHGLDSLDLLGGPDLNLDHDAELDFDPADCLF